MFITFCLGFWLIHKFVLGKHGWNFDRQEILGKLISGDFVFSNIGFAGVRCTIAMFFLCVHISFVEFCF